MITRSHSDRLRCFCARAHLASAVRQFNSASISCSFCISESLVLSDSPLSRISIDIITLPTYTHLITRQSPNGISSIDPVDQLINSHVSFVVRGRRHRCNIGRNRHHRVSLYRYFSNILNVYISCILRPSIFVGVTPSTLLWLMTTQMLPATLSSSPSSSHLVQKSTFRFP